MAEAEMQLKAGQAEADIQKTQAEAMRAQAQAVEVQQSVQMANAFGPMPPPGMTGDPAMATL